jgi:hypothetical protein
MNIYFIFLYTENNFYITIIFTKKRFINYFIYFLIF